VERDWLEVQLGAGRSIEAIAAEVGRDPSTVAYWVNKYGLVSTQATHRRPRGAVDRDVLAALVEQGHSIREIAASLGRSAGSVRHWLRRHGLKTQPARYAPRGEAAPDRVLRECALHGWVEFARVGGSFRCPQCISSAVSDRRRAVKRILVAEAGGRCAGCGYDRCLAALHFHHVEPGRKAFSLGGGGAVRSLSRLRFEAQKCVLLCANCHAEVESGLRSSPVRADHNGVATVPG
jgi:transposase